MRTSADPERDDALLQATLQDEAWQTKNAAFKAEALRTFRVRQRVRQVTRWAAGMAALGVVIVSLMHLLTSPAPPPRQALVTPAPAPKAAKQPRHLTDEELLASFPEGSCFLAEVDGKKELVFLDPKLERTYLDHSGVGDHY